MVVGAGGLGCPALWALAPSGTRLVIADDDVVDVSNLHRQILHRTEDVGRSKAESARDALVRRFARARVEALRVRVEAGNARAIVGRHAVVLDGTDSVEAKFLLNDACVGARVPLVHGGASGWTGQVMSIVPGGPCYRCLFEAAPEPGAAASCVQDGILGPVAGVVGAAMARAARAILDGRPTLASGLMVFDARSGQRRTVRFRRRPGCEACGIPSSEAA